MQTTLTYRTNSDLFSNYYLDEHLPETEAWNEVSDEELQQAYDDIVGLWDREKSTAPKRNEAQLEERFIRPMFRRLNIPFEVEEAVQRGQRRPDYGFFETEDAARDAFERREAGDFYAEAIAVADAKRWGRPLDTRGSGEHNRDFENPSYQIHVYLREVDAAQWAVLTNGQKWRLYYGPTSHRLDSYYEVDLPTILEDGDLEDFKYFYLFFRQEAFIEDAGGDSFLDDVYGESNVFAQELGEDLQENIYEAINVLSEGYLHYSDNDLDEEDLDLIHDSSLIYLYRLIFVLYAEAEGRDLLDTDNAIYEEQYSLNALKQEIADELDSADLKYRDWQDNLSSRLDELFSLIDQGSKSQGIPEEDLYIPAYNGGLFRTDPDEDDSDEARFLANHTVGDGYLARVVELVTRSQNGGGKIFVDYSSLDVRHLGSIYEGLLAYTLEVADGPLTLDEGEYVPANDGDDVVVNEDKVYLTTGSGERKATGSYYTPEYVVEYMVDETLGPLVDDIRDDLAGQNRFDDGGFADQFADQIFELKVLDPAMGSGHFLTSAIDYLAREIIDAQERQAEQQGVETIDTERDINWARRNVAQRCIYGVDLNPLAVELAKVSLWLRTLAAEQPLAFLDHHLKTGNSLVGSDIEAVLTGGSDDIRSESGQLTLQQSFDRTRQHAIEHVMNRFQDLLSIDNETLEDAKEMEDVYDTVRKDPLYQHLLAMANVHTAEQFGVAVPSDAYQQMAEALRDKSWTAVETLDWFQTAQTVAGNERFFHWELEFPVAFYDRDGNRIENAGFDAVIGNPPYVSAWSMTEDDEDLRAAIKSLVQQGETLSSHWDLYFAFLLRAYELTKSDHLFSYILPNSFCREKYGSHIREFLLEHTHITEFVSFGTENVFQGVSRQTVVPIFRRSSRSHSEEIRVLKYTVPELDIEKQKTIRQDRFQQLPGYQFRYEMEPAEFGILDAIDDKSIKIGNTCYVNYGAQVSSEEPGEYGKEDVVSETKQDGMYPFFEGSDINEYYVEWPGLYLDYRPETMYGPRFAKLFGSEKIAIRKVSDKNETLLAGFDKGGLYCDDNTILVVDNDDVVDCDAQTEFQGFEHTDDPYDLTYVLSLVNSTIADFYYRRRFSPGSLQGTYSTVYPKHVRSLPLYSIDFHTDKENDQQIPTELEKHQLAEVADRVTPVDCERAAHDQLSQLADIAIEAREEITNINTYIGDYLHSCEPGRKLSDITGYQPISDRRNSILSETKNEKENLRIGDVNVDTDETVVISATARFKPADPQTDDVDRWGYTETDYIPVIEFVGLEPEMASLIREFIPHCVEESPDYANFYENATKTISLIDRLESIVLPELNSIRAQFSSYLKNKQAAEKREQRISMVESLTDTIVYDLYNLTDEEIAVVESAMQSD